MPAVSGPQYRAMAAAQRGNSTLGIPEDVGREFVHATPKSDRSRWSKKKSKKKGMGFGKSGKQSKGHSSCR